MMTLDSRTKSRRFLTAIAVLAGMVAALTAPGDAFAKAKRKLVAPPPEPSLWERETLTGDWGGRRTALKDNYGIEITLIYISEVLGVMSGGINRTSSYEGRVEFAVDTDLEKLIGLAGAKTHFKIYQIHDGGRNAVANVGSIADPSNIDALPTTRLFTAWYEQKFGERFSLRVGQLAADDEFITSPTAGGLINGTFGWAGLLAANITNGGPAYPLAAPGARLATSLTENLTLLTAVFAGNPAGRSNCTVSAQECNEHGLNFGLAGGALWMSELQYGVNQGKGATGLPALYKLGAWYSTANFADVRYGRDAGGSTVLRSDPTFVDPLNYRGNWGVYGVIDQTVMQRGDSAVSLFLRGGASPTNRNTISYYVDGGVGFKGPFASRPNDTLTFGTAYAKISKDAISADIDAGNAVVRRSEVVLELSYAAQLAPWWILQPDLQYIVRPGANVVNPNDPAGAAIKNAFVAGVRSTIKF